MKQARPYSISNPGGIYFITFATVHWLDIFTKTPYRMIVVDSLAYCQKHKGLQIHAWCIMTNHLHLMLSAKDGFSLSAILRDFKRHTAGKIIEAIINDPESRKEWMLWMFQRAAQYNPRNKDYQVWQQNNYALELISPSFTRQKLDYIHNNPVCAGWVDTPEHFLFSSARDYAGCGRGPLDLVFL